VVVAKAGSANGEDLAYLNAGELDEQLAVCC